MITLKIDGLQELIDKLGGISDGLEDAIASAGEEAGNMIIRTQGLQNYPPAGPGNSPPTPYYIRGRGMQIGGIRVPEYNTFSSQRLGTRWVIESRGLVTTISNTADYAPFAHGQEQAYFMANIGWRKLDEVGQEKVNEITQIYQAWINRLIKSI